MLNIAIAGLGTVGGGVMRLLHANGELAAARAGQPITVKAVSARDKNKKRDCNVMGVAWVGDARKLAAMKDIDAVVELIGGAEGIARELAEATLKNGKHYITANKALIAAHGVELAKMAEKNKVQLLFEASVAGGIPALKTLREGLAGNRISSVRGILNGTCNYILTRMGEEGLDFDIVLKEAQKKGYAEADPSADTDGHDTANKLVILAALAFGIKPDLAATYVEGIRHITKLDLQFADELGCRIKLLGTAYMNDGALVQHVGPALMPKTSPLANVNGALNAVMVRGDFVGDLALVGPGAGAEPTASAVVVDIIDLARGHRGTAFGIPAAQLTTLKAGKPQKTRYYVRLQVIDKPGVGADILAVMRDEGLSMETILQRTESARDSMPMVLTTHEADAEVIHRAMGKIAKLPTVVEPPRPLHIEN